MDRATHTYYTIKQLCLIDFILIDKSVIGILKQLIFPMYFLPNFTILLHRENCHCEYVSVNVCMIF